MNKIEKNSKAITLIALVITIIVLLILAGVTISTLTGQNGLLNRAKEAGEKTKYTSAKETVNLKISDGVAKYLTEESRTPTVTELAKFMSNQEEVDILVTKYYESASTTEGITMPTEVTGFLVKDSNQSKYSFLIGQSCEIEKVSEDDGRTLTEIDEYEKNRFGMIIEDNNREDMGELVTTPILTGNDENLISSGYEETFPEWKAFNGITYLEQERNDGNGWEGSIANGNQPYLGYNFNVPIKLYKISIWGPQQNNGTGYYMIYTGALQGSNDYINGSTTATWETIQNFSFDTSATALYNELSVNTDTKYSAFRIIAYTGQGRYNYVQISEMKMYGIE